MYPKGNLIIPASHGRLEAILKEPTGKPKGVGLVCHPHPLGGGTMHNKVVFRIASGLLDAGLITLRFNFRGVGASTGVHNEVEGGKEDVRDVLDYLATQYPGEPITLAGFSFGSRVGTEVGIGDERVVRLISIGNPVNKYDDYDFLLQDRKPILFVQGDRDEFGGPEKLEGIVDRVSKKADAQLIVVSDSGHFFEGHLDELRAIVKSWTINQIDGSRVANYP